MKTIGTVQQEEKKGRTAYSIAPDITGFKFLFVNYYAIGQPGEGNEWWLVDAGLPGSAGDIIRETGKLFGKKNPPTGIVLTHGHFDHVGALPKLLSKWQGVKIYAHPQETPFLTGQLSYPPPDPSVRGSMSRMSWMFPTASVDLSGRLFPLKGTEIPGLPDWNYIDTPGHSPGHISLYRKKDRMLIAGDAFVTTNQNSLYSALSQRREMHAPPAYYTIHWSDARNSVKKLADLAPEAAGTGHGLPFFGDELRNGLQRLLLTFEQEEMPVDTHYVKYPVDYADIRSKAADPPKVFQWARGAGLAAAFASAGLGLMWMANRFRRRGREEIHEEGQREESQNEGQQEESQEEDQYEK